jgi:oligopeptidase B
MAGGGMIGGEPTEDDVFRPGNWREVIANTRLLPARLHQHFALENSHADEVLAPVADLTAEILDDLVTWDLAPKTVTYAFTANWHWQRVSGGGADYPVFQRVAYPGAAPEAVLDVNALAEDFDCPSVSVPVPAPDERWLAYAVDERGNEQFGIWLKCLATGETRCIEPGPTTGALIWNARSTHLFCVVRDQEGRATTLAAIAVDGTGAKTLLQAPDPTRRIEIRQSADASHLTAHLGDCGGADVFILDLRANEFAPRLLLSYQSDVLWDVDISNGEVFVRHNAINADAFSISSFGLAARPDLANELVRPEPGSVLVRMAVHAGHLIWTEAAGMRQHLGVRDRASGAPRRVALPAAFSTAILREDDCHDARLFRLDLSSLAEPRRGYALDPDCGSLTPFDPDPPHLQPRYATETIHVAAPDGARIPVSLVWRDDRCEAGPTSCLLLGYGAYGRAQWPDFDGNRRALLDRGVTFAIAHVRGGSENGWGWYRQGKGTGKEATFSDYLAVADHLISSGRTAPDRLAAFGRSAGGILMGVMANRHPDRFRAILAEVPFVDVMRTISDASLPLTPPEWAEWGNPLTDPTAAKGIAAYSPVDNLREAKHPAVLCMCGL